MYSKGYGHCQQSPPVNPSPLSPPSCSTGSDGSSLSIDETDGYPHPMTPDENNFERKKCVIKMETIKFLF